MCVCGPVERRQDLAGGTPPGMPDQREMAVAVRSPPPSAARPAARPACMAQAARGFELGEKERGDVVGFAAVTLEEDGIL